jgi:hypothetical protein
MLRRREGDHVTLGSRIIQGYIMMVKRGWTCISIGENIKNTVNFGGKKLLENGQLEKTQYGGIILKFISV